MNEMTSGHIVKSYDKDLEALYQSVIEAGHKVEEQIVRAVQSLEDEDLDAANQVILQDQEIDEIELKVDDQIVHIIAKRQPMAKDLREILAVSKIMSDLERIGDQARRIARLTLHFYEDDSTPPAYALVSDIPRLALRVIEMVRQAVDAFTRLDSLLAVELIRMDTQLDEEMKSALRRLSTYLMEDARSVGHVVDVTLGLRAIERIGSHAAYVARHTIFLVKGKDVRHESLDQVTRDVMS